MGMGIEELDLSLNTLSDEFMQRIALCKGLEQSFIKILKLKECQFSERSFKPLLKLAKMLPFLSILDLSDNDLSQEQLDDI